VSKPVDQYFLCPNCNPPTFNDRQEFQLASDTFGASSDEMDSIDHEPIGVLHYSSRYFPPKPHHASELDALYWKNMFLELGFGENVDDLPTSLSANVPADAGPA